MKKRYIAYANPIKGNSMSQREKKHGNLKKCNKG